MRTSLPQWRYWLAAALLLLAGAMGGAAAARLPVAGANAGTDCQDGYKGSCAAILTATGQPTILQALSRLDGKALDPAHGSGAAGLPPGDWTGFVPPRSVGPAPEWQASPVSRHPPGRAQPRAPPAA